MTSNDGSSLYCCGSSVSMSGNARRSTLFGSAAEAWKHTASASQTSSCNDRRIIPACMGSPATRWPRLCASALSFAAEPEGGRDEEVHPWRAGRDRTDAMHWDNSADQGG